MEREFVGSFGDFLALKRKDAGITIKDMAQKLKISAAYYSYFESGDRKAPEREVQDQLADILDSSRTSSPTSWNCPPLSVCNCMTWLARRAASWRRTSPTTSTATPMSGWRCARHGTPG